MAETYHPLGMVSQTRRSVGGRDVYRKSLEIHESLGNRP